MEKLTELLQQIADKIGVTVQYLWPKVVLLHWIEALVELVMTILVLLIAWPNMLVGLRQWIALGSAGEHDESKFVIPVIRTVGFGLMAIMATIVFIFGISTAIGTLISPEGSLVLRALKK